MEVDELLRVRRSLGYTKAGLHHAGISSARSCPPVREAQPLASACRAKRIRFALQAEASVLLPESSEHFLCSQRITTPCISSFAASFQTVCELQQTDM
jgi:hypothetical protein